jgi:hypothetical protein
MPSYRDLASQFLSHLCRKDSSTKTHAIMEASSQAKDPRLECGLLSKQQI